MSTVQELLAELRQSADQNIPADRIRAVVQAVNALDTLLVAFFPATRNWFITKEQNAQTAVIFSSRSSFELFAERCKEQGLYTEAMENPRSDRAALFTDLIRCGFTRILIDYAPDFLILPVTAFCTIPDLSGIPLVQRPFLSPALTGSILYLMQQIHSGKADGGMEIEMLRELYHAPLLMPVQAFRADGRIAYNVPAEEKDGKRTAHLFTDRFEWDRFGVDDEYSPAIARFPELQTLFQSGFDRILINSGSGAELALDAQLLQAAEQAVMGDVQEFDLRTMQEKGEKLTVSDPDPVPEELTAALSAVLEQYSTVKAAYLRVLKQENSLHPSWLVLLDLSEDRGRIALCNALNTAAQPHLGSNNIEFAVYRDSLQLAGKAKPFYQKKRSGWFR